MKAINTNSYIWYLAFKGDSGFLWGYGRVCQIKGNQAKVRLVSYLSSLGPPRWVPLSDIFPFNKGRPPQILSGSFDIFKCYKGALLWIEDKKTGYYTGWSTIINITHHGVFMTAPGGGHLLFNHDGTHEPGEEMTLYFSPPSKSNE